MRWKWKQACCKTDNEKFEMKDIIIVGGGYAGIAIKGYLKSKYIKIYEASNIIEGTLKDCQVSNDFFAAKLIKNLARNRSLRYFLIQSEITC